MGRRRGVRSEVTNLTGAFLATMTVIYAVVAFVGVALTFGAMLVWVAGA